MLIYFLLFFPLWIWRTELIGKFLIIKTITLLDTNMTSTWLFSSLFQGKWPHFPSGGRNLFLCEVGCGIIKVLFWQFYVTDCIQIEIKYLMNTWTGWLICQAFLLNFCLYIIGSWEKMFQVTWAKNVSLCGSVVSPSDSHVHVPWNLWNTVEWSYRGSPLRLPAFCPGRSSPGLTRGWVCLAPVLQGK